MGEARLLRKAAENVISFEDLKVKDAYRKTIAHYKEMIEVLHNIQDVIGSYIPHKESDILYVKEKDMGSLRRLFYSLINNFLEAEKILSIDKDTVWEKVIRATSKYHKGPPPDFTLGEDELKRIRDEDDSVQVEGEALKERLEILASLLEKRRIDLPFARKSIDKHIETIKKIETETVNVTNLIKEKSQVYMQLFEINRRIENDLKNWFRSFWDDTTHPREAHEKYGDQYDFPSIDKDSIRITQRMMRYIYSSLHNITSSIWYILKLLQYETRNDEAIKYHISTMYENFRLLLELDKESAEFGPAFLSFPYGKTEEEAMELSKEFFKSISG